MREGEQEGRGKKGVCVQVVRSGGRGGRKSKVERRQRKRRERKEGEEKKYNSSTFQMSSTYTM